MKNILIIQGHPDSSNEHFCHAIADKYTSAAKDVGHTVKHIVVADIAFPLLTKPNDYQQEKPCEDILNAQQKIVWADHLMVIYPMWLGDMPALLKGFFEQVLRPGFAYSESNNNGMPERLLKGKSARIVVTMGMPALFYRWYFKAHTVKNLSRNILSFCGFKPIKTSLIGRVFAGNEDHLCEELSKISHLGRLGQ